MAWELDIWGKIRRGVEAADANLDAQIENYDDVLVMIQAEVAAAYIQMRTLEEQLAYTRENAELQRSSLEIIQKRFEQGLVGELDVRQAGAQLATTESLIPRFDEAHRRVQNGLCLLVGMPPGSLQAELGEARPIPAAPAEVVVGIPADLLRRRPDVRRAERQAAAQSARIGIAEAEFYPHVALTGSISFEAEQFGDLFDWRSVGGRLGPGLQWNILNYGRIRNGVRVEDARFQQAAIAYQNTVLAANKETEDAIVAFLREQQRVQSLQRATDETLRARDRPPLVSNKASSIIMPRARFSTGGRPPAGRVSAEPGPGRDEPRGRLQSPRRRLDDAPCIRHVREGSRPGADRMSHRPAARSRPHRQPRTPPSGLPGWITRFAANTDRGNDFPAARSRPHRPARTSPSGRAGVGACDGLWAVNRYSVALDGRADG